MFRRISTLSAVLALSLIMVVPAFANPGKPNFGPSLYGDGAVWGSKGANAIPAPNGKNLKSFDKLVVFSGNNLPVDQLPVAEATPGNPAFNGGRWFTHTVTWNRSFINENMGNLPTLKSYADIMFHANQGDLIITAGPPQDGPPAYFECPLLPVK